MAESLGEWLSANGLSEFEEVFVQNQVDLETLFVLTDTDLKELQLPFGPRKRILNTIAELKNRSAGRPGVETPKASSPGERRQLTVMFCDLVGSTALSTVLDPEELNALIKSYRAACGAVVSRYAGHVAQYLGDGILVYFGWPVAYEDSAERAVRSALDIINAVKAMPSARPLALRIGLATGPVVVGEDSPDGGAEAGLAVGETPNLAARLLALANPGEIVIASATRRLLGNAFSLTDLGRHSIKGIERPVQAWRLDEVRRVEDRFKAAHGGIEIAPLVGREDEATLLEHSWEQSRGGSGQVVLIVGQAGIGKSRLTQGMREGILEPHTSLRYQCSPFHLNSPLHPFIEELESCAGFAREDTPAERFEKLEVALADLLPQMEDAQPLFAALLSLPARQYPPLQLSPQKQKEKTLEALIDRVRALARRGPVMIAIEDVHWIDPTSQDLLELLVPIVRSLPVLLVMTYRPEYLPPWTGPHVHTVALNRLSREHGAALVASVTRGKALPPEVLDEVLARTDGIPLFVEELTRSVLESGLLREEDDHYVLQGPLSALAIPVSLRDSLMARLDRLGKVKELAQIGACIGREFSFELLHHISTLPKDALDRELRKLVDAGLVSRNGATPAAVYTFKHALVQDAAYESLLKRRRGELHSRIADVLENEFADRVDKAPELLAYHLTQAGQLSQAIPLWRRAGTLAVARVALKEAVAHFTKGLGLIDQLAPSLERDGMELTIREPLNAAWTGLRGWAAPEVGVNSMAILRLAESRGNRRNLCLALWWVWTSTITQGRIANSQVWADRLLAEGLEASETDLKCFGHLTAHVQYFLNGRLPEAQKQADLALALFEPGSAKQWIQMTGHDLRTFVEVYNCQLLWIMGYPDRARKLSDECVARARSEGHAFNLVWALTFSAYVFAYRREPGHFLERLGEADQVAREQGLPEGAALYQYTRVRSGYDLPRQLCYANPVTHTFVTDRLEFLESTASFRRIDLHWCLTLEPSKVKTFEKKPTENAAITSRMLAELEKTAALLAGNLSSSIGLRLLDKQGIFQFFSYLFNLEDWAEWGQLREDVNLDRQIVQNPVAWENDHLRIGRRFVQMYSLKTTPEASRPCLFADLLKLECDSILCSVWRPKSTATARHEIDQQEKFISFFKVGVLSRVMAGKDTASLDTGAGAKAADNAVDDLSEVIRSLDKKAQGEYSLRLLVATRSVTELHAISPAVHRVFVEARAQVMEETLGNLSAFYAMFPGNGKFNVFPMWLGEDHNARLSSIFAPNLGHPRSEDLDNEYLNIFETRTGTPFFQDAYVDGVRVQFILGPTGSGKSVTGNLTIAHEQKYNGFTYIFDIGGSYESVVELYGGRVDRIGNDGPRVNPFTLEPTESNIQFLYSFIKLLLTNGGAELEPEDDDVIHKAVQDMYLLDAPNRRLSNLFLPKKLDRYLSKWVGRGVYNAIFDNVEDSLSLSRIQCFDFQGVNNAQYADLIEPLMVWLLRRINDVLFNPANLGVPKHILIEEIFSSMKNRQLLEAALASIKTVRKNLGGVTMIGQSAEDLGAKLTAS